MSVKRVSPEEALDLVRDQGYVYLDVRSVPEFEQGHPAGAYNAPVVHMGPMGSQPNADFLPVIERRFPKEAGLPTSRQAETGRAWEELRADEP
jgi:rhodanese-related sulfurtransferase